MAAISASASAAAADDTAARTPIATLRRRNSTDALMLNTKNQHPSSSSSTSTSSSLADYELVSLKPASYTSLRDILPSSASFIQSPKVPSFVAQSGYEISIRNRLVKQAAWAYLRPMSTSSASGGSTVLHRLWNRLSDAVIRLISHICHCFLSRL